jgi:hypothetical protein
MEILGYNSDEGKMSVDLTVTNDKLTEHNKSYIGW